MASTNKDSQKLENDKEQSKDGSMSWRVHKDKFIDTMLTIYGLQKTEK